MARDKQRPGDGRQGEPLAGREPPPEAPPARAAAYIPPMAVPKESRYHTIDMKAVRLSPDIDPQRMKTQLSLRAVQAAKPPSGRVTRWLALLLVGGAIGTCAWWFSRWRLAREPQTAALHPPETVAASGAVHAAATFESAQPGVAPVPTVALQTHTGEERAPVLSTATAATATSATATSATATPGMAAAKATAPVKVGPKTRPLPRKVNAPAVSGEPPKPDTEAPKLWLE